jgi:hypothetical protein
MDVLLLGAAAIVLIALTVWIVWRPADAVRTEEASDMLPQGDRFEDQYTSATADLSAGGVAITGAQDEPPPVSDFQRASEPWSQPSLARESGPLAMAPADSPPRALPEPAPAVQPKTIGIGAAALLTLGGAIGGAWLYARWQKSRNQPLNRLKRRFR